MSCSVPSLPPRLRTDTRNNCFIEEEGREADTDEEEEEEEEEGRNVSLFPGGAVPGRDREEAFTVTVFNTP